MRILKLLRAIRSYRRLSGALRIDTTIPLIGWKGTNQKGSYRSSLPDLLTMFEYFFLFPLMEFHKKYVRKLLSGKGLHQQKLVKVSVHAWNISPTPSIRAVCKIKTFFVNLPFLPTLSLKIWISKVWVVLFFSRYITWQKLSSLQQYH